MPTRLEHLEHAVVARSWALFTAAAFMGVAVVHFIDGPGSLSYELYVGVVELTLAAASAPLAVALVLRPVRDLWIAATALALLALGLYLASRGAGLSGFTADIGKKGQILGVANMATELAVISLGVWALQNRCGERS
jgi:hypothetical protein